MSAELAVAISLPELSGGNRGSFQA